VQLVNHIIVSIMAGLRSERGQDLLEYAMLGGLIAAAIAALLTAGIFSGALTDMANGIKGCIDFAPGDCTGGL